MDKWIDRYPLNKGLDKPDVNTGSAFYEYSMAVRTWTLKLDGLTLAFFISRSYDFR